MSASALGRPQVVRMLVKAKADINDRNEKARAPCHLIVSVSVCVLLSRRIDIGCDVQGETPIFVACLNGRSETVKALVQLNADVNNECNDKAIDVASVVCVCCWPLVE